MANTLLTPQQVAREVYQLAKKHAEDLPTTKRATFYRAVRMWLGRLPTQ